MPPLAVLVSVWLGILSSMCNNHLCFLSCHLAVLGFSSGRPTREVAAVRNQRSSWIPVKVLSSVQPDHDMRCRTWHGWWHGAFCLFTYFHCSHQSSFPSSASLSAVLHVGVHLFSTPHSHGLAPADFIFSHIHLDIKSHFRSLYK